MQELLLPKQKKLILGHELFTRGNPVLFQQFRNGKLIDEDLCYNGITTEGKNDLLDTYFGGGTQITDWYQGQVDNSGFSALSDTDTAATHGGWTEFTTYSQSTRPQWTPIAASAGSITNTASVTFDITGSGTLYGMFMISEDTKSGTSGILWATAAYNAPKVVSNGDQVKLTYTLNC